MSDSCHVGRPSNVLLSDACRCAEVLAEPDFRDSLAYREYLVSGLCQRCMDGVWIGSAAGPEVASPQPYSLRRGLVFAHSRERDESALIPFVFGAPARPVGWDLAAMVRVGRSTGEVDAAAALSSLRSYTLTHRVGVVTVDSAADPLLDSLCGAALVVAFQSEAMERFVNASPALRASPPVLHRLEMYADDDLGRVIDYEGLIIGAGLDPGYDSSAGPPGALRLCAWAACALHIPDGDRTLLDGVLAPHRRLVGLAPRAVSPAPFH